MIVAGVMSGTSADGINVALVRIEDAAGVQDRARSLGTSLELIGHAEFPYSKAVRKSVLSAMNAERASVADLARLNFLLGELYSDSILATQRKFRRKAELVGCHGQTLYHQGEPAVFLRRKISVTWQTGEGAVIAARVGVPVVTDFRPADMAVGGKGAPLVPFLDYLLYRDKTIGRIAQNIGGIANLTAIPAEANTSQVIAFDTGPGNMVMDALTERFFHKPFDQGGKIAASGSVIEPVIEKLMRRAFFRRDPPKTAGREEFGRAFVADLIESCGRVRKADLVATATALTARSIGDAFRRFIAPGGEYREMIVSGGGARNATLLTMLAKELTAAGLQLRSADEFGLPAEAKEAVAFALLAHETWNRRSSNMPSATGAGRAVVLGKISHP